MLLSADHLHPHPLSSSFPTQPPSFSHRWECRPQSVGKLTSEWWHRHSYDPSVRKSPNITQSQRNIGPEDGQKSRVVGVVGYVQRRRALIRPASQSVDPGQRDKKLLGSNLSCSYRACQNNL